MKRLTLVLLLLLLGSQAAGAADDDDAPPPSPATAPSLSPAQQQAVGIRLAPPLRIAAPGELPAYGQVLDSAALIAALGQLDSGRAAAEAARLEAQRLESLYRDDNNASLRAVQSARAAQVEAQSQARAGAALFAQQWGPLAQLSPGQRRRLAEKLAGGKGLLLRAELPGQASFGRLPTAAFAEVDGVKVPARVLGALPRMADAQGAGLLLQLDRAPAGLGPGARLPVKLQGAGGAGLLVPSEALLYGEQGAFVYRQREGAANGGSQQYEVARVELLQPLGDGWLVGGLDADDRIVVRGAGVLWSLQGLGGFSAAEEDHD
ncbi:MAG TPA: hypothetical protein VFA75_16860 [Nevskia sp.]|nr:hypothetical protein [Nevskia sp.]